MKIIVNGKEIEIKPLFTDVIKHSGDVYVRVKLLNCINLTSYEKEKIAEHIQNLIKG